MRENAVASYQRVLELATAAKDQEAIAALNGFGPPPWHAAKVLGQFRRVQRRLAGVPVGA